METMTKTEKCTASENELNELTDFYLGMVKSYHMAQEERVKKHIRTMLSYSWNYLDWISPLKASEKAEKKAKDIGCIHPLAEIRYNQQLKPVEKGGLGESSRGKDKIFQWEHAFTRSDFVREILALKANTDDELFLEIKELVQKHQIVWILAEEDKVLTKSKFQRERPNGWESAYEECHIKVL